NDLLRLFDGWYRPAIQLIESTPSSSILKTGAFDRQPNSKWGLNRISMLGDAVHPTTPNFGQGGCMAIEDAMVLARHVRAAASPTAAWEGFTAERYKRT